MKKWSLFLIPIFIATVVLGAGTVEKIRRDQLILGESGSVANKIIEMDTGDGGANPKLTVDQANKDWSFSTALKVLDDLFTLGDGTAGGDKVIVFDTGDGGSNKNLTLDATTKDLSTNADNLSFGDGTVGDKELVWDKGLGASNPRIRWNDTSDTLQFSNDGTAFKNIGSGGGAGGINQLQDSNPDCEAGDPPNDWTSTGGTFIAETGSPGFNDASCSWNASASSQFLRTAAPTIEAGLQGRSCNATIQYKWNAGNPGDLIWRVEDSSNVLIAEKELDPSSDWREDFLAFTCPSSGDYRIEFESTADAALMLVDNVELGQTNQVFISQAELTAQAVYNFTASCIWTTSSTSFVDFPTDSDCPAIQVNSSNQPVNTADDDLPTLVFDQLLPGKYIIQASGMITNTVAVGTTSVRIADSLGGFSAQGSNTFDTVANEDSPFTLTHSLTITQAQAVTFNIQGAGAGSSVVNLANNIIGRELQFTVYRFPLSSSEAITLETTGFLINAKIVDAGGSTSLGSADTGAFVVIQDATLTLTNFSNATVNAKITCADATSPIGDDCGGADEQYGINFDVSSSGNYKVCFRFNNVLNGTGGSENIFSSFNLVKTTASAEAIVETYPGVVTTNSGTTSSIHGNPNALCSIVALDVGNNTIRMRNYTAITTGLIGANLITTTAAQDSAVFITVMKVDQQFPTPVFLDLQASLNSKIEQPSGSQLIYASAKITNNGATCVATQDDGLVSSVARIADGNCTITLTSIFNGNTPKCLCTSSVLVAGVCLTNLETSTTVPLLTFNVSGTPIDDTVGVKILCVGLQ